MKSYNMCSWLRNQSLPSTHQHTNHIVQTRNCVVQRHIWQQFFVELENYDFINDFIFWQPRLLIILLGYVITNNATKYRCRHVI